LSAMGKRSDWALGGHKIVLVLWGRITFEAGAKCRNGEKKLLLRVLKELRGPLLSKGGERGKESEGKNCGTPPLKLVSMIP